MLVSGRVSESVSFGIPDNSPKNVRSFWWLESWKGKPAYQVVPSSSKYGRSLYQKLGIELQDYFFCKSRHVIIWMIFFTNLRKTCRSLDMLFPTPKPPKLETNRSPRISVRPEDIKKINKTRLHRVFQTILLPKIYPMPGDGEFFSQLPGPKIDWMVWAAGKSWVICVNSLTRSGCPWEPQYLREAHTLESTLLPGAP